jgi:hypothetical protein
MFSILKLITLFTVAHIFISTQVFAEELNTSDEQEALNKQSKQEALKDK